MQPYLFPYIGYFQLINAVDIFVMYDDANYIKQGWINRNRIILNGKEYLFTFPLENASCNKAINQICFFDGDNRKKKAFKMIQQAYSRAPEFKNVIVLLTDIILNKEQNIGKYIECSLRRIIEYLDIETKLTKSSELNKNKDLRGKYKLWDICKIFKAGTLINPIGGEALYNKAEFKEQDINLWFLRTRNIIYKQNRKEFIPSLSIIDVMMFNPKDEVKKMLSEYELL